MIKNNSEQLPREDKQVLDYILGTLNYTPLYYVKKESAVDIKVYAPGADQPTMKLFRMIIRCNPIATTPEHCTEVAFQDEVNVIQNGHMLHGVYWQVNFSIHVNKKTFQFESICKKPASVTNAAACLELFAKLSKQAGATLYAGDWKFVSNGEEWQRVDYKNQPTTESSHSVLVQSLLALSEINEKLH